MGFWRYEQQPLPGAGCFVGKNAVNLQVSVPCGTPVQGRLGDTSRKEALLRLCGAVCTPSFALPSGVFVLKAITDIFFWLFFFLFILGNLKT